MNAYRRIPNINILPKEHIRAPLSLLQACLIVIILVAAVSGGMAYKDWSDNRDEKSRLEQELEDYQITPQMNQRVAQADQLRADITALNDQLSARQQALQELQSRQVDWTEFFSTLLSTSAPVIDEITQSGLEIRITGTASGILQLQQYRSDLLSLGPEFSVDIPELYPTEEGLAFQMVIVVKGE